MTHEFNQKNKFIMGNDSKPSGDDTKMSFSSRIIILWLMGTVILLPVHVFNLPFNTTPVDFWILIPLPILWAFIIHGKQPISLSYTIAMWIILFASLMSTVGATKPSNSLVVIFKEFYVFIWFITLVAVIPKLSPKNNHRLMVVWTGVALLHGLLIIAQFISPDLWRSISGLAGKTAAFTYYRPAGLFLCDTAGCANKAAYFQLLGFVPLMLAGLSKRKTAFFGVLLLMSILATGSMGATLAFIVGLITTIVALAFFRKRMGLVIQYFFRLGIAVLLLGGIFFAVISQNDRLETHFRNIVVGRADRSSEGRFALWERGMGVLIERNIGIWGIGPNNFRVVDWLGKQLHNDLLAFLVERGILGAIGLVSLAFIAITKAINLLLATLKTNETPQLVEVIFLAAITATVFESLTHQIFHDRQLWFVLALLEAMVYTKSVAVSEMVNSQKFVNAPFRSHGLVLQREIPEG